MHIILKLRDTTQTEKSLPVPDFRLLKFLNLGLTFILKAVCFSENCKALTFAMRELWSSLHIL